MGDRRSDSGLAEGGSQDSAGAGFLHEGDDSNVLWVCAGFEFQLNVLSKALSLQKLSYLGELLHNRDVNQVAAAIFSAQDLRLYVIESDRDVNVGVVSFEIGIRFNAGPQHAWISGIHGHFADAHGNFGSGRSFLQSLLDLFGIACLYFVGSIDNELGSI